MNGILLQISQLAALKTVKIHFTCEKKAHKAI